MDISKYNVEKFYDVDDIIKQVSDLRLERAEYMEKFNTLDKAIINAAKTM
jgi:phosphoenolpyruvate carboxykinase (ATP)